jgi:hypothetical protein
MSRPLPKADGRKGRTSNLGRQARADLADLRSYIATENSERVADNVVEGMSTTFSSYAITHAWVD